MTTYIPLTRNQYAIVDDEDAAFLLQWQWQCSSAGYATRTTSTRPRKTIRMHRLITNPPTWFEVDHINRNKLDNRRANLRVVTHSLNQQNHPISGRTSEYRGVYWRKQRQHWVAKISTEQHYYWLGQFKDEGAAARAYDRAALGLFGHGAQLNFPGEVPRGKHGIATENTAPLASERRGQPEADN